MLQKIKQGAEGLVVILIGLFLLVNALNIQTNPIKYEGWTNVLAQAKFMPTLMSAGITIMGVVLFIKQMKGLDKSNQLTRAEWTRMGIVLVLLGPIVQGKGWGRLTGVFGSLYNHVTGYFGDILSYTRLMALMLAGSVIAQVFNMLAAMPGNVIAFIIISMLGNAMNFGLNLLGCYVHDLRLQCLEFFNKFYVDGGKPFRPMTLDTEYVDLQ